MIRYTVSISLVGFFRGAKILPFADIPFEPLHF